MEKSEHYKTHWIRKKTVTVGYKEPKEYIKAALYITQYFEDVTIQTKHQLLDKAEEVVKELKEKYGFKELETRTRTQENPRYGKIIKIKLRTPEGVF